jgi:hypothetical protein
MPTYVGLGQQGFYEPYQLLQAGLAQYAQNRRYLDETKYKRGQDTLDRERQARLDKEAARSNELNFKKGSLELSEATKAAGAKDFASKFNPSTFSAEQVRPPGLVGPLPPVKLDGNKPWQEQAPDVRAAVLDSMAAHGISAPQVAQLHNDIYTAQTGKPVVPSAPTGMQAKETKIGDTVFEHEVNPPQGAIPTHFTDKNGTAYTVPPASTGPDGQPIPDLRSAVGPDGKPVPGFSIDRTGQTHVMPKTASLTEVQAKARMFAGQMAENRKTIDSIETNPKSGYAPQGLQVPEGLPFGRLAMGPAHQNYMDAKNAWINSKLRFESGAAISKDEYVKADRQYFPQPGDSPENIARKRELRLLAEKQIGTAGEQGEVGSLPQVDVTPNGVNAPQGGQATAQQLPKFGSLQEFDASPYPPGTVALVFDPVTRTYRKASK